MHPAVRRGSQPSDTSGECLCVPEPDRSKEDGELWAPWGGSRRHGALEFWLLSLLVATALRRRVRVACHGPGGAPAERGGDSTIRGN